MIRKKDERMVNFAEQLRGGKGTTEVSSFLTEAEAHGVGRGFSINTLLPGCSIGWHQHTGDFEVYLILEGKACVTENDGTEHLLEEGDMMFCEEGEYHAIENKEGELLRFLSLILYPPKS